MTATEPVPSESALGRPLPGSSPSPTRRAAWARPRPRQPRCVPGRARLPDPGRRPRSAGQRHRPAWDRQPRTSRRSMYDVIMHDVPLEDCIEPTASRTCSSPRPASTWPAPRSSSCPAFSRELELRAGARRGARRLRLRAHRLPAVARPAHRQRPGRGRRGARADPVRVLRARGSRPAAAQRRPRADATSTRRSRSARSSCVMYDARTKLADQVVSEVREHFGDKVCRTVVPRTVRLSEAPSFGQPIIAFDPTLAGRHRLPGAGQGGERWRGAAGWVRGSAP